MNKWATIVASARQKRNGRSGVGRWVAVFEPSDGCNVFAAVPQYTSHPNQLVEEFVYPPDEILIQQFAGLIKKLGDSAEVQVLKDCDQAEFAHNRQQILDHARSAKRPRRNATNAD